jgi:hypothetical protein
LREAVFGLAAFIFGATAVFWLSTSDWPNAARTVIGIILGALALVISSESIRWVNSREKLLLAQISSASDKRAEIRTKLQQFYVDAGPIITRTLPKDIHDIDFEKYAGEAEVWATNTANWIGVNMGIPARERFLDRTGMLTLSYEAAVNEKHNSIINSLTTLRKNLLALIESGVWDKQDKP